MDAICLYKDSLYRDNKPEKKRHGFSGSDGCDRSYPGSTVSLHGFREFQGIHELREIFEKTIPPTLHPRGITESMGAAYGLFGKMGDTIREAALMPTGRNLGAEALAQTARASSKEIFRVPAS
jgi:hypothetical protein